MSSDEMLKSRLNALQSHFTWDLKSSRQNLTYLRIRLEDIGTEEGNFWLGHVYNLLGFIQYQLGSSEDALNLFNRAAETFQRQKNADEGPWLMVNFGNLAWLHHHLGEDEKSEDYLSKVDGLMRKYPAPPELERHPEVLAEKAWTLMKFDKEKKLEAAELFQRAIEMQPDTVEWQSSYAILSAQSLEESIEKLFAGNLEELRSAKERDPDNLCIAALYLEAKAASIKREARELAERILERPINNYCGIDVLLSLYMKHISKDEAVDIAKEALRRHPDSRYVKRAAAKYYTKKILSNCSNPDPRRIKETISLWEEVVDAYPESSLKERLALADVQAKIDKEEAEQIYKELLEQRQDLDPAGKQMLYCRYAKYLFFMKNNSCESTEYHMRAAEIQEESKYRHSSITELKKTLTRETSRRNGDADLCKRIKELLARLGIQPATQNH
ncbi:interferon-induced protein with tetratricopeptide repeats 2-like [Xiphophorus hellerii]|uniref:interferon-induced protein with tetratricopeptide repeats 2-like n=1 Tax=Xiphophorus hellerii TaxID=8084 RepID=UPI0013B40F58|nr:interferon-induced protein with tetratricopeptide repeats 2-like [Xiphophorus hellerii]XP_032427108.1 interferon-induced protein with tetratricopeptide repeats 2-like [Xiphophorus hellerii]XP_032427109.1 interferon-induced protein with tetratricopeptide repeats 2-like [Xiphophorus hellerii]